MDFYLISFSYASPWNTKERVRSTCLNVLCLRFAKWIQETPLPKELKGYCKNVLDFLGQEVREFKADMYTDTDEENDFHQEVQEFDEASSEEEDEGDYDDDEEEEEQGNYRAIQRVCNFL